MKILLWDIELSFAIYYAYPSKKPQFLRAEQIKHHQFMICAAWKWMHEDEIQSAAITDNLFRWSKNRRDDYYVVESLHKVLSEADVLVGHNADGFDLKHFNYKAMLHGFDPIPPVQTIDTLKEARKVFNAPSNSMDNLLKAMGHVGKQMKPTREDWVAACEGDAETIKKVTEYCKYDIEGQEFLYKKIRPFMKSHPNFNLSMEDDVDVCPRCASPNLIRKGFRRTNAGKKQRYKCTDCGGYCCSGRSVKTVNLR